MKNELRCAARAYACRIRNRASLVSSWAKQIERNADAAWYLCRAAGDATRIEIAQHHGGRAAHHWHRVPEGKFNIAPLFIVRIAGILAQIPLRSSGRSGREGGIPDVGTFDWCDSVVQSIWLEDALSGGCTANRIPNMTEEGHTKSATGVVECFTEQRVQEPLREAKRQRPTNT
jgi:hypothetical protein